MDIPFFVHDLLVVKCECASLGRESLGPQGWKRRQVGLVVSRIECLAGNKPVGVQPINGLVDVAHHGSFDRETVCCGHCRWGFRGRVVSRKCSCLCTRRHPRVGRAGAFPQWRPVAVSFGVPHCRERCPQAVGVIFLDGTQKVTVGHVPNLNVDPVGRLEEFGKHPPQCTSNRVQSSPATPRFCLQTAPPLP